MKKERIGFMAKLLFIIGVICILYCLGILLIGVYGSWFFLIWGAGGLFLVSLSLVIGSGMWGRLPSGVRYAATGIFLLGLLFFLFIEGLILSGFGKKGEENLDYLIVLGAQMRESGPSRALQMRLDKAYDYLQENGDTLVIVSGGQGSNEPISEAQGMYDYLVGRGISPERIRMEDRSTNTYENLIFSRELIEEGASVGIVTNNFHVYRSLHLAKAQGYSRVCGIAAPSDRGMQANNMFREFFGVMKDWVFGNMRLW